MICFLLFVAEGFSEWDILILENISLDKICVVQDKSSISLFLFSLKKKIYLTFNLVNN